MAQNAADIPQANATVPCILKLVHRIDSVRFAALPTTFL
jgi:hypothetical protein